MVRAMYRLVLVAVVVASTACTQTENSRPLTLEYITQAILQPSCGQVTCHSSFRRQSGFAFDSNEMSRLALPQLVMPNEPQSSLLYTVLTRPVARMPLDSPLQQKDIDLIEQWIAEGAEGLEAP
jgi:hypothetical protein